MVEGVGIQAMESDRYGSDPRASVSLGINENNDADFVEW